METNTPHLSHHAVPTFNRTSLEWKLTATYLIEEDGLTFNRTSLEWKLTWTCKPSGSLNSLLIAPVWNGNIWRARLLYHSALTFNRTSLEWKPDVVEECLNFRVCF